MARPSPRTVGETVDPETGEIIQFHKFGTQQLEYIDPMNPALGVKQLNVGQAFKGFTQTWFTSPEDPHPFGSPTLRADTSISGTVGTTTPDPFPPKERCTLDDNKPFCAITQAIGGEVCECPDWFTGKVTDPTAGGRGCECEACKNGTGQCDASAPECDAWDLACIAGTHTTDIITKPAGDWWEKYGIYVYLILGVIGLGILLWLLRPLFSMIGAFKGGSP